MGVLYKRRSNSSIVCFSDVDSADLQLSEVKVLLVDIVPLFVVTWLLGGVKSII